MHLSCLPQANHQKILVIDDSGLSRMMLIKKLKAIVPEAEITEAVNGKDGIEKIKALIDKGESFDMVFLDQLMPEMNGLDALKIIRKMIPDLPVVMLTANVQVKVEKKAVELGCTEFVHKTTENAHLARILGKA